MNSTIVLNRLTAARAEGGNGHAVTQAQALVGQYYPGRDFDVETTVNAVFNALDAFNREGAETAINEALATLARPEPTPEVATDADVATDTVTVDAGHEARIAALETLARDNGYGHLLAVPNGVGSHEARITALENAARTAGLR